SSQRGTGVPRMPFSDDNRPQAGAAAARTTGFSTIGRLITAESTPSRIESHQTASYDPVRSNNTPPSHTPRKTPTGWLTNANPNSIASQRFPNMTATRPEVGGTVDSQNNPITAPKTRVASVLGGSMM